MPDFIHNLVLRGSNSAQPVGVRPASPPQFPPVLTLTAWHHPLSFPMPVFPPETATPLEASSAPLGIDDREAGANDFPSSAGTESKGQVARPSLTDNGLRTRQPLSPATLNSQPASTKTSIPEPGQIPPVSASSRTKTIVRAAPQSAPLPQAGLASGKLDFPQPEDGPVESKRSFDSRELPAVQPAFGTSPVEQSNKPVELLQTSSTAHRRGHPRHSHIPSEQNAPPLEPRQIPHNVETSAFLKPDSPPHSPPSFEGKMPPVEPEQFPGQIELPTRSETQSASSAALPPNTVSPKILDAAPHLIKPAFHSRVVQAIKPVEMPQAEANSFPLEHPLSEDKPVESRRSFAESELPAHLASQPTSLAVPASPTISSVIHNLAQPVVQPILPSSQQPPVEPNRDGPVIYQVIQPGFPVAGNPAATSPPTVEVHIGTLEVRASQPPPASLPLLTPTPQGFDNYAQLRGWDGE